MLSGSPASAGIVSADARDIPAVVGVPDATVLLSSGNESRWTALPERWSPDSCSTKDG